MSPAQQEGFRGLSDATVLDRLYEVIDSRRSADPERSHTARLLSRGTAKIAQKMGEEAIETVIAGIEGERGALAAESADLLYHLLVLWADRGLKPEEVWSELERRRSSSGVDEKASRKGGA
jgi:phosphoribosyl-ATP pyrophosphohydrolase